MKMRYVLLAENEHCTLHHVAGRDVRQDGGVRVRLSRGDARRLKGRSRNGETNTWQLVWDGDQFLANGHDTSAYGTCPEGYAWAEEIMRAHPLSRVAGRATRYFELLDF